MRPRMRGAAAEPPRRTGNREVKNGEMTSPFSPDRSGLPFRRTYQLPASEPRLHAEVVPGGWLPPIHVGAARPPQSSWARPFPEIPSTHATCLLPSRSNFACHCLQGGLDVETLREQMGHGDTESLGRFVKALGKHERAGKMAEIWLQPPEAATAATSTTAA